MQLLRDFCLKLADNLPSQGRTTLGGLSGWMEVLTVIYKVSDKVDVYLRCAGTLINTLWSCLS